MARVNSAQLHKLVDDLQRENLELRAALGNSAARDDTLAAVNGQLAGSAKRVRSWGWALFSAVLITIGAVLAPVALVSSWADNQLTDTSTFVATFAPLAADPDVQSFVTEQTVAAIGSQIDIDGLTSDAIDGITGLGLSTPATAALNALKGVAAQGIRGVIVSTVNGFVSSDSFQTIWQEALRASHTQLIAAMNNDPTGAISIGSRGEIGLQLGPIISQVKAILIAQGMTFAESIPTIDRTIVIAQSDSVTTAQLGYGLVVALGTWLPWVGLAFLVAGVLVARRRVSAVIGAAIGLGVAMVISLAAIAVGGVVFQASVSPDVLPARVADVMYTQILQLVRDSAVAVTVLAIVVALVAWFAGPFRLPRKLRSFASAAAGAARASGDKFGLSTRAFGRALYKGRAIVRVGIAAIAAVVILFVRPLSPSLIIWTLVVAVIALILVELLQRPPVEADAIDGDAIDADVIGADVIDADMTESEIAVPTVADQSVTAAAATTSVPSNGQ